MTTPLQSAQTELETDVRREINWFAPAGERHFVDPATISAVATVLIGTFLGGVYAGLKESLKDDGKTLGKDLGHFVVERLRAIIAGKEKAKPEEAQQAQQQAKAAVDTADPAQTGPVFDSVEAQMRDGFAQVMPDTRAAELAASVRQNAVNTLAANGSVS